MLIKKVSSSPEICIGNFKKNEKVKKVLFFTALTSGPGAHFETGKRGFENPVDTLEVERDFL